MLMRENLYGIHWEPETNTPLWQITSDKLLCVDITEDFGARYKLTAYRFLTDEEHESIMCALRTNKLPSTTCGISQATGETPEVLEQVSQFSNWGWNVTNNASVSPGLQKLWKTEGSLNDNKFQKNLTRNPDHSATYQVQFSAVPYSVFKRYWRKPINLNRKFHYGRNGFTSGCNAAEVFRYDLEMIKKHNCFFLSFTNRPVFKDKERQNDLRKWMIKYARAFYPMADNSTPFVKGEAEALFTIEWLL